MITTISGIPCQIEVTHYLRQAPNIRADNPDDFYGYTELEFDVLDRRGRPAPWLERKLDDTQTARIKGELLSEIATNDCDDY